MSSHAGYVRADAGKQVAETRDMTELLAHNPPTISRVWAMPSKWTFSVAPLCAIIQRYKRHGEVWLDPFAGWHSPAEITNDLNPQAPTHFHVEALEFLESLPLATYAGVIFDPPYSLTQVARSYANIGLRFKGAENPTGGFPKVKDAIARMVCLGGTCGVVWLEYGWNGQGSGF